MVVKANSELLCQMDLAYLSFFLGLRVNELVLANTWEKGFKGVRESHGYVVQHLIESERTITELARRMEVTQQAASKMVAELVRLDIVEATPAKDRRVKRIRLSRHGWQCVHLGRQTRAQIDKRLTRLAGRKAYENAKSTLLTCLDVLGGIDRIVARRIRAPR